MSTSAKDFLTRAERRVGGTFSLVMIALGALGLYAIRSTLIDLLAFAVTVVGGTIALLVAGAIAVFGIMLLLNPAFQTELWHAQNRVTRWVSAWAMKQDPFGRLRAFADEYLDAKYETFNKAAERIQRQLNTIRSRIAEHEETLAESNRIVAALQQRRQQSGQWASEEDHNDYRLEAQRITFIEGALTKARNRETMLATLVKIVDRWRNTFLFEIESTRMSAQFLEDEYHQANDTAGAIEAASSAFGQGDMARADKQVRDYIKKLTSERMAQADVLMKQIPELTRLGDLRGDIAEDEITARLSQLDNASQRAFVEVQEDRRQLEAGGASQIIQQRTAEPVEARRRYLR